MNEDELISNLQEFELSKDEAEIYVGLLRAGPSRVSQICNFIQINRVKGYRLLGNLMKLGLVSSTFSNPTVFSANDLEESLENLVTIKKFEVNRLEKTKKFIKNNYHSLNSSLVKITDSHFNIISGRYNIFLRIEKMIKEEPKEIYIITTYKDLEMMYYTSISDEILKAQKNGKTVRIVFEIEKEQDLKIIKKMKVDDYRIANLPSKGRIVCGQSEALVSGYTHERSGLNSDDDSAVMTNSAEFVSNMHCLCLQLWKSGKQSQLEQIRRKN